MEAGDALFFHCNLLHCSDKNDSDRRRWAFLIAYNCASNDPVIRHHCPQYTKLEKVYLTGCMDHTIMNHNTLKCVNLCRFLILLFWIVPLLQILQERTF